MENNSVNEEILGGESACYAHLLCESCGAVLDDSHLQPCPFDDQRDGAVPADGETQRRPATP
ncbi:MAG TPA: hypothetical protein VNF05_08095 [Acidimicrobiales bacterium]|nr:hypothetical protein [Acidimicrobiales bacterium]